MRNNGLLGPRGMGPGLKDGLLGEGVGGIYIVAGLYSYIYNTIVNIPITV